MWKYERSSPSLTAHVATLSLDVVEMSEEVWVTLHVFKTAVPS